MLIRLIQMHSKIRSKLPSWQAKSKPERGLGSAPGRFRLAAPCFARISQRHLITHRSCHVHKVAAAMRRSVEIRTLFLCPRSLPPSFHQFGLEFGVFLRHWPRRRRRRRRYHSSCLHAPLLRVVIAKGRPTDRILLRSPFCTSFGSFHFP